MFVVKHYVAQDSCLLKVTRNKRVIDHFVANMFGEVLRSIPFIKPRYLKAMVWKELGIYITNKVCRNARSLVLI